MVRGSAAREETIMSLGSWSSVLCCVVGVLIAQRAEGAVPEPSVDDRAWSDFLGWLQTAPQASGPAEILNGYRAAVRSRGGPPAEADAQLGVVMRLMRERTDAWVIIFRNVYGSRTPNFSVAPSPLLLSAIEGRRPGLALDVGMGQGRNAVALAQQGWQVTGFDISDEGLALAKAGAAQAGVSIEAVRARDDQFDYGVAKWDLIAVIYGPGSIADARFVERLHSALKPGGIVVVESFASPRTAPVRRPVDIDPADLLRAFSAFRLLRFEDVDGTSEWDPQTTPLVRMVAQKRPGPPAPGRPPGP
jgi:SAM-dependent methyltransferase